MPLTFIDIEKQKNWRISILFLFLLLMYFLIMLALIEGFYLAFSFGSPILYLKHIDMKYIITVLGSSIVLAMIHFYFSAYGAVRRVLENLNAVPPDPDDGIHKQLKNIINEIHIVTGSKRRIDCRVIPSFSMNALAVADMKGNAAIAITEGLLSRLTRPQLEAVIAHEAYHILSGDCVETTVATSLFGMYAAILERLRNIDENGSGGFHPAFILFYILMKLSQMLSLFISREREYRADAGSVRMTRNPLAMAEALYLISHNWRGSGFIGQGLEMLCIINPQSNPMDESEGWWSSMMSTHPPIGKRIRILLNMARVSISELEIRAKTKAENYNSTGIVGTGELSEFICPHCKQHLFAVSYEKTRVYQCNQCRGVLVENDKIPRIIARREKDCTDRVKALARAVVMDNQRKLTVEKIRGREPGIRSNIRCLKCSNPMFRTFYSLAYLIEIDRCGVCGITWFDVDELEMLQCLIENRITANTKLL